LKSDDLIYITYEILKSTQYEQYNVRIEITNEEGKLINTKNIYGDIGSRISGGNQKNIIWNYTKDQIDISKELYFQIYATKTAGPNEEPIKNPQQTENFNMPVLIAQSLALPGWGLSRLSNGKPYWIMGLLGYGCIAGSVILNRSAADTFTNYLSPSKNDYVPDLYANSVRQDNFSEILAYSALGIWIGDLVWTFVKASKMKNSHIKSGKGGITLGTGYESISGAPLVVLKYQF